MDVTAILAFPLPGRQIIPEGTNPPAPGSHGPLITAPNKGDKSPMTAFPLTGPHRASGHASNVFRRSAAHNFGKHATPAVLSRKTVAASSSPTPIPGDGHPPQDTRVSRQIATVEPTELTVKKSVPRCRLTRLTDKAEQRAVLDALKV